MGKMENLRTWYECQATGDLGALVAVVADSIVMYDPRLGRVISGDEFWQAWRDDFAAFAKLDSYAYELVELLDTGPASARSEFWFRGRVKGRSMEWRGFESFIFDRDSYLIVAVVGDGSFVN